jgi:hypothetical protein
VNVLRTARIVAIFLWALLCPVLALAQERGPSTAAERARALQIIRQLEQDPLNTSLRKDREWVLRWLIEIPDIQVTICAGGLGEFLKSEYKYRSEVLGQLTFGSAAFVIENPAKTKDEAAACLAGVRGALAAYKAILKSQPSAKSPALDELAAKTPEQLQAHVNEVVKKQKK